VTAALDDIDRRLLNEVQGDFPLTPRPFAELGRRLGITEEEVIERLDRARSSGVLRHLSGIFDVFRIGYRSTLVAMHIPGGRLDEAAAAVSAHPAVSHNYGREHFFNLWFVIAVPRSADMERIIAELGVRAGSTRTIILPALKLYKIDVEFDMVGGAGKMTRRNGHRSKPRRELTSDEIEIIRRMQRDLALVSEPFEAPATELGYSVDELLGRLEAMRDEGIMRRFAGVLRHREAGFLANGMACWKVPEERAEEVGEIFSSHPKVSHCYKRPTYEDWPYSTFTMIHAHERAECEAVAAELSERSGISEYEILYSHTEYKKERVQYFLEDSVAEAV
jgi:DNA-binding Lrp family transcriptional regulator